MATTPLGLLGDAIAGGAAQYAAQKNEQRLYERNRADRQADVADARSYEERMLGRQQDFQREVAKTSFDREMQAYERRADIALKNELVRMGYLSPKDAKENNLEAIDAALKKAGVESQRDLDEFKRLQAMIPTIIANADGVETGVESGLSMTVEDLPKLRTLVTQGMGEVVLSNKEKYDRGEKNKQIDALLVQGQLYSESNLTRMQEDYRRLMNGDYTDKEISDARTMVMGDPQFSKIKKDASQQTPAERAMINAAVQTKLRESSAQKMFMLQRQIETEAEAVAARGRVVSAVVGKGISGYMQLNQQGGLGPGAAPAGVAPKASAPATPADANAFLGASTAQPPAAIAPAGSGYGGVRGAIERIPPMITSAVEAVPNALMQIPRTFERIAGGDQLVAERDAERAAMGNSLADRMRGAAEQSIARSNRGPVPIITAPPAVTGPAPAIEIPPMVLPAPRDDVLRTQAEDEYLARYPDSPGAAEIRRRRGTPRFTPSPIIDLNATTVR